MLNNEGKISSPASEDVFFDLSGIFDAEGDNLTCTWDYSEGIEKSMVIGDDSPFSCSSKTLNFGQLGIPSFNIILEVCDVINPCVSWQTTIDLVNQMPTSEFEVIRSGNKSKDIVSLQSSSVDPEEIRYNSLGILIKMGYLVMNPIGRDYLLVGCMKLHFIPLMMICHT